MIRANKTHVRSKIAKPSWEQKKEERVRMKLLKEHEARLKREAQEKRDFEKKRRKDKQQRRLEALQKSNQVQQVWNYLIMEDYQSCEAEKDDKEAVSEVQNRAGSALRKVSG